VTTLNEPAGQATVPSTAKARLVAALLGASFLGVAVWFAVQIYEHAESPVYPIPESGKEVVLLGVIAIATATVASMILERGWVAFLFAFSFLLIFFGVLFTLFGIPLIALGWGLFALAIARVAKIRWSHRWAIIILGGVVAVSMGQLVIARGQSPLVQCTEYGAIGGESRFSLRGDGGGSSEKMTGEAISSLDGGSTGTMILQGGRTYSYVCRNGELVEFTSSG